MTAAPRISVVVPNYNHAAYLDRRLGSIFAQTRRDFEVIFLDDASNDDSVAIARRWAADHPLQFDLRAANSGNPFVQWNRGVQLARGEFVWIAESDDDADPALLATLVGLLESSPAAVVAYCQSLVIDAADTPTDVTSRWYVDLDPVRWTRPFVNDGADECRRFLVRANTIPNASAVVFRRDAYLRAAPPNESLRHSGDWLTWAALLGEGALAYTPAPLNRHRKHGANLTDLGNTARLLHDWIAVAQFIDRRFGLEPAHRRALLDRLAWFAVKRAPTSPSWAPVLAALALPRTLGPSGLVPHAALRRAALLGALYEIGPCAITSLRALLSRIRRAFRR